MVISGENKGEVFVAAFPYGGGYGASAGCDGLVNGTSVVGMASFPSIEMSEQDYPIQWNRFGLREGSGGPGHWAGGCGNEYDFTVEVDTTLSVLGDQSKSPPAGVLGGSPGAPNEVAYTLDGEWRDPDLGVKVAPVRIHAGDRIRARSPGGGGYGAPDARDHESVGRDVALGLLTAEAAIEAYGWEAS
jgi:N-methylhydantoinase B